MSKKIVCFFAFAAILSLSACGGKSHSHDQSQSDQTEAPGVDKSGPEYTSAYICPMYCTGSGSSEPGECPVCGMDYVANEKTKAVEPGHEGHNH